MQKQEYSTPKLTELGNLQDFTKNSWSGLNMDGALPEETPEIFS